MCASNANDQLGAPPGAVNRARLRVYKFINICIQRERERERLSQCTLLIGPFSFVAELCRSGATASDVPELKPIGERVLIKVFPSEDSSGGGVFLPESAKERPMVGEVVRVGSGKKEKNGKVRSACPDVAIPVAMEKHGKERKEGK